MYGPAPLSVSLRFRSLRSIWLHQSSATELILIKTVVFFHLILSPSRVFLSSELMAQRSLALPPCNLPLFQSVDVV